MLVRSTPCPNAKDRTVYVFWCPACDREHRVATTTSGMVLDPKSPTFPHEIVSGPAICRLRITAGTIRYHADCHHGLAGKSAKMVHFASPTHST